MAINPLGVPPSLIMSAGGTGEGREERRGGNKLVVADEPLTSHEQMSQRGGGRGEGEIAGKWVGPVAVANGFSVIVIKLPDIP